MEALAAGIPSIFTLSGVAREFIIHEENALVVPFKDSDAIYESMVRLMNDPALCANLTTKGVQNVNRMFRFDSYIEKLQKLYRS
ncbi:Glycosyl transferases group 1 [compost metagenome]